MDITKLKVGAILSETSFFKVTGKTVHAIAVEDDFGNSVNISNDYVENILSSADLFEKEEKMTMTGLAELFIGSPRVAMTVAFIKKSKKKTKKAYDAEVSTVIEKVQNARVSEVEGLLKDLIANPISKEIPGELRVMKGRHYGKIDDLGRIHFIDMEVDKGDNPDYDARSRQVDPRTIQYLIVNNVKYTLK